MTVSERGNPLTDPLNLLSQTAPNTTMGALLRRFWQPIAVAKELGPRAAKRIRILSEDLTLYRGESGRAYLVGGRCAHRSTLLHTGWIEGERIRCMYHGWQYDGSGQCIERPAEGDKGLPNVKIVSYPTYEYAGLIFAFMGEGQPPEFELPRKAAFERPDYLIFAKAQVWPCNWFQQVENSFDAVHVSFAHRWGQVGAFGEAVTAALPQLEYFETDAGVRQIATRPGDNPRINEWTFPNNNYLIVPCRNRNDPWVENSVWMVPIDDEHTMRIQIRAVESRSPAADADISAYFNEDDDYNPADYHDDLFNSKKMPADPGFALISAQDYVAQVGQGTITDRTQERLGKSDKGIVFLRRIFWRELKANVEGRPIKQWRKLRETVEMPKQGMQAEA